MSNKNNNEINVLDLFCGAGGLSLGFEMAGFNIVAGVEIEPTFLKTYKKAHTNTIGIEDDISTINIKESLNNHGINPSMIDVVIGGPPCQGFSTAGNRMIDDPRNHLVKDYAKVVGEIKPKMFVMENVSGLSSMKNGLGTLVKDELIEIFSEMGYNVKSKVLLAADYGVPQLRKRIFFVGVRNDFDSKFKFPQPTHYAKGSLKDFDKSKNNNYLTVKEALSDLPPIEAGLESDEYLSSPQNDYQVYCRQNSDKILNHKAPNHNATVLERIRNIPQGGNHSDLPENLKLKRGYPNIYGKLDENKPADTITGNCGCASAPGKFLHPTATRVLTVREASRLQSFPDNIEFEGSMSKKYKQVGNAVPPLLAKALALEVKKKYLSL
jgi:DNA (cytosine-5)-methyltransferase 1